MADLGPENTCASTGAHYRSIFNVLHFINSCQILYFDSNHIFAIFYVTDKALHPLRRGPRDDQDTCEKPTRESNQHSGSTYDRALKITHEKSILYEVSTKRGTVHEPKNDCKPCTVVLQDINPFLTLLKSNVPGASSSATSISSTEGKDYDRHRKGEDFTDERDAGARRDLSSPTKLRTDLPGWNPSLC